MIPTDIPKKIRPQIHDPSQHSVIYTFSDQDIVEQAFDYSIYRLPHSPCTYWTNFKIKSDTDLWIDLILITAEGTAHSILSESVCDRWHPMYWPLPSIDPIDQSGFYFKINYMKKEPGTPIHLSLLGFIEIYPTVAMYYLMKDDECQFIVFREDLISYEQNKNQTGSIRQISIDQDLISMEGGICIPPLY
jgi:hypothetical protein